MNRKNVISQASLKQKLLPVLVLVLCVIVSVCVVSTVSYAEEHRIDSMHVKTEESVSTNTHVDLTTDDVMYLTQLGLLRGHLKVGIELYRHSSPEMSETHMKHPSEELYADLIPAFEHRGCKGFADELTDLARVVSNRDSNEAISLKYELLTAAISRCEAVAEQENRTIVLHVVMNLLSNALLEYEIGVVDMSINNLHEYQDAWGFIQIADEYLRRPVFLRDDEGQLIALRFQRLIASLEPLWPSLNPTSIDNPNILSLLHQLRAYTKLGTE